MSTERVKMGFEPVYDNNSRILILGSFPSVKSREIAFYYGNKQNRFWKTVCGYFGEDVPETVESKKDFLLRRQIALWDMVTACEINGSADASIKNVETADLERIFQSANVERIFLNGTLSYDLFVSKYKDVGIAYQKLPSTSPANPRFSAEVWRNALNDVYRLY